MGRRWLRALDSPWVYAAIVSTLLAAYHRRFFVGLALFDDALYQALAESPHNPLFERWSVRAGLLTLYHTALSLAPSRSIAILALGWAKTFVFVACASALLATRIDRHAAVAIATIAALTALWHIEFTVLFPDSLMAAVSLLALYLVHLGGKGWGRFPAAGAVASWAMYTKEQAIPTVVAVVWQTPRRVTALAGLIVGALASIAVLTIIISLRLGDFWADFFPFPAWYVWAHGLSQQQGAVPLATAIVQMKGMVDGSGGVSPGEWFPALGNPLLHYSINGVLALGVLASAALKRWTAAPARGLLVWWLLFTLWIVAAVATSGVYEWRYWLVPRLGLVLCGLAGWWLLLESQRWGRAFWSALAVVVGGLIALNAFSVHQYYWLNAVGIANVERRVADAIDRLPAALPLAIVLDQDDPEEAIGPGWSPERIRMRLVALSETTPPRPVLLQPERIPARAVVVTNVRPVTTSDRAVVRVFLENMPSIENLWISFPAEHAVLLAGADLSERTDTLWRSRPATR